MEENAKPVAWAALMDSLDLLTKPDPFGPAVVWSKTQRRQSLSCICAKNSSRKSTKEQRGTVSIDAHEPGTLITAWATGGFSKAHLSGNRKTCGYKEFHSYVSVWINLTLSCVHKQDSLSEPSMNFHGNSLLPWSWDTSQGCSPRHRDLFLILDLWMSPIWAVPESQLDCVPGETPLEQGHPSTFGIP